MAKHRVEIDKLNKGVCLLEARIEQLQMRKQRAAGRNVFSTRQASNKVPRLDLTSIADGGGGSGMPSSRISPLKLDSAT